MKPLQYRSPTNGRGTFAPWLNSLANQSGAYVIRRASDGAVLYVGESHTGRLAKTIKRHFFAWRDDPERKHHVYQPGRVEIAVRITPPNAAPGAQNRLIRRLKPRDNGNGYGADPF